MAIAFAQQGVEAPKVRAPDALGSSSTGSTTVAPQIAVSESQTPASAATAPSVVVVPEGVGTATAIGGLADTTINAACLVNNSISEEQPAGAAVGLLPNAAPHLGHVLPFSRVDSAGGEDNRVFIIPAATSGLPTSSALIVAPSPPAPLPEGERGDLVKPLPDRERGASLKPLPDGERGVVFAALPVVDRLAIRGGQSHFRSGENWDSPRLLSQSQMRPIVSAALARWASAGRTMPALDAMKQVHFVVADLPGAHRGFTEGPRIALDANAAGHGWFIDPTPASDEEFAATAVAGQEQAIDAWAVDHIDLLAVVEHELGHTVGLDDLDPLADSLMSGQLESRIRRTAFATNIDTIFANPAWHGWL